MTTPTLTTFPANGSGRRGPHTVVMPLHTPVQTASGARRLAAQLPDVVAAHLPAKGRGGALNAVWSTSDAEVLAYMDVDLSTDLAALLPLVSALVSGHSDVAIGSRSARGAHVLRGPKRELISRTYNLPLAEIGAALSHRPVGTAA